MADTPKHSVSVAGVVVRDDGCILAIQRRDNQHWEPPGGVLELSETFEAGVQREVFEETGVHVEVEHLTGVYKNMNQGIVALVFRCRPLDGFAGESNEARRVLWLTIEQVTDRMDPAYAIRVTDALANRTAFRAHDGATILDGSEI